MSWRKLETTNKPEPVRRHTMIVYENEIYVFGGVKSAGNQHNQEYSNILYKFDICSSNWKLLEVNKDSIPELRCGHTASLKDETMYIYGGSKGTTKLEDFWSINLKTLLWNCLDKYKNEYTPKRLAYHQTVIQDSKLYLFGGSNGLEVKQKKL